MQEHNVTQGSPEWLALRAQYFTASEAPAMMGCSPYMTRSELLAQKHTGLVPDVDANTQRLFDNGHATEAAFRPLAEVMVGDDLYPVTGSVVLDGLPLLASFDGLTMDGATVWEHKAANESTAGHIDCHGEPPIHHVWQLEQQMLVSGAVRALFVTSDGTMQGATFCTYTSKPERRAALLAGWRQFAVDLAAYTPTAAAAPKPQGEAPSTLPALRVEVTGMVTASNLADFKATALAAIRGVNRTLETDQHFANAEASVKWCADVEERIKGAKQQALAQTASIDELFRAMDEISAEARAVRLELEKLVKNRKEDIKAEIQREEMAALGRQLDEANRALGRFQLVTPFDERMRLAGAMKGKKTVASLRDAASTERARIASEISAQIEQRAANIKAAGTIAFAEPGIERLWPDLGNMIDMPTAQLEQVLQARIIQHRNAERERAEAAAQAAAQAEADAAIARAATPAPAPAPAPQAAPTSDAGPFVRLGEINEMIAPLAISADGLATLGFEPARQEKGAKLYHAGSVHSIITAMIRHLNASVARGTANT